jgi:hypothetical protein
MFILVNDQLTVEILDPIADQARLGARYCTGGYIFQITDHRLGPLLSGPTYPESFNVFDGQGIPDAFNLSPLRSIGENSEALVVGVGICDLSVSDMRRSVTSFCAWECAVDARRATMVTQQVYHDWSLELTRSVELTGRTVRSAAHIRNTGRAFIPLRWFPHPFYPQTATDELIKLNLPVSFPENPGYEMREDGYIARKGWPWDQGYYLPLDHASVEPLVIQQRHPLLGQVSATCSYAPDFFPIWGNPNTFSWEPFLERTLAPGQELRWWIDYDF